MDIWYLAKIPYIATHHATKKLEKLFNKWRWLQKREKKTSPKDLENRKEFSDKLGLLFDIASLDWEKEMSTDSSRILMREQRISTFWLIRGVSEFNILESLVNTLLNL